MFPCDAMRMVELNPSIALPFSEDRFHFAGLRIYASDCGIFVVGDIDVVGIINAQMFGRSEL